MTHIDADGKQEDRNELHAVRRDGDADSDILEADRGAVDGPAPDAGGLVDSERFLVNLLAENQRLRRALEGLYDGCLEHPECRAANEAL